MINGKPFRKTKTIGGIPIYGDGDIPVALDAFVGSTYTSRSIVTPSATDPNKIDIDIIGEIKNATTGVVTKVVCNRQEVTVPFRTTNLVTYMTISPAGEPEFTATEPTPEKLSTHLSWWVIVHRQKTVIEFVNDLAWDSRNLGDQVAQILNVLGALKSGMNIVKGTDGLKVTLTSGTLMRRSIGETGSNLKNIKNVAEQVDFTVIYRLSDSTIIPDKTGLDPNILESPLGTEAVMPNNRFSVQRVYIFPTDPVPVVTLQPGQNVYLNKNAAIASLDSATFEVEENIRENGTLLGFIIIESGISVLTDPESFQFIPTGLTGSTSTTSVTPTLQSSYEISVRPQFKLNATQGAIETEGYDNTSVLERWLNGDSNVVKSVDAAGVTKTYNATTIPVAGEAGAVQSYVKDVGGVSEPYWKLSDGTEVGLSSQSFYEIDGVFTGNRRARLHGTTSNEWVAFRNFGNTEDFLRIQGDGFVWASKYNTPSGYYIDGYQIFSASYDGELFPYSTKGGYQAGIGNTGAYQTVYGSRAGNNNTGLVQTAVGRDAGNSNSGTHQWAGGYNAGAANSGDYVTLSGALAGVGNSGDYVVADGYYAAHSNQGLGVLARGRNSGRGNTGDFNIFDGYQAGYQLVGGGLGATSSSSMYYGANTKSTPLAINENVFGYIAEGSGSNTFTFGNSSITHNYFQGAIVTKVKGATATDYGIRVRDFGNTEDLLSVTGDGISYLKQVEVGTRLDFTGGTDNFHFEPIGTELYLFNTTSGNSLATFANTYTTIEKELYLGTVTIDNAEATALFRNGSGAVVSRELGSNAFSSESFLKDTTDTFTGTLTYAGTDFNHTSSQLKFNSGTSTARSVVFDVAKGIGIQSNTTGGWSTVYGYLENSTFNSMGGFHAYGSNGSQLDYYSIGETYNDKIFRVQQLGTADNLLLWTKGTTSSHRAIRIRDFGDTEDLFRVQGDGFTYAKNLVLNGDFSTGVPKPIIQLNSSNWFNLGHQSGTGSLNWFTAGDGTNWINTHPTLQAKQLTATLAGFEFKVGTNTGSGAVTAFDVRMRLDTAGNLLNDGYIDAGSYVNVSAAEGYYQNGVKILWTDLVTDSVAVGYLAGGGGSFTQSVSVGNRAGQDAASTGHTLLGFQSGRLSISPSLVAIGTEAGRSSQASLMTSMGFRSGYFNLGDRLVSVGTNTGRSNEGADNTNIGYEAGFRLNDGTTVNTTSSQSLYLGSNTRSSALTTVNENVLGYLALGNGNNTFTFGNSSITANYFQGQIYTQLKGSTATDYGIRARNFANTKDIFSVTGDGKINMDYGFSITGGSVQYNMYVNSGSDTLTLRDITNGQTIVTITPTFTILDNRIYLPDTPTGATDVALILDGSNGIAKRTLGSNAFSNESYLKDTTDTFTGVLGIGGTGSSGIEFNGGSVNYLLYSNAGDSSLYLRDLTGSQTLVHYTPNKSIFYKPIDVSGQIYSRIQGNTSTDYGVRVRNFADTEDYLRVQGDGFTYAKKYDVSAAEGYYQGSDLILRTDNTSDTIYGSTWVGVQSGTSTQRRSTMVGYRAGNGVGIVNSTGELAFLGYQAGYASDATFLVAVGSNAGRQSTSSFSVFNGYYSGYLSSGVHNIGAGYYSMRQNSGNYSTGSGSNTGYGNTGSNNSFFGYNAGTYISDNVTINTTSSQSLYLGSETRSLAVTTVNENVLGYLAVGNGSNTFTFGNSSITHNYFQGEIYTQLTGSTSTDYGIRVRNFPNTEDLFSVTGDGFTNAKTLKLGGEIYASGGLGIWFNGQNNIGTNTAFGQQALNDILLSGINNSAFGIQALLQNEDGASNSAFGAYALTNNTTGIDNVAVGAYSLQNLTTGQYNTALGRSALSALTTGTANIAIGRTSLFHLQTGGGNLALGYDSGRTDIDGVTAITNLNNATYLGTNIKGTNNSSNEIVIGHGGLGGGSNTITFGSNLVTHNYFQGEIYTQLKGSTATDYGIRVRDFADTEDIFSVRGTGFVSGKNISVSGSGAYHQAGVPILTNQGTQSIYLGVNSKPATQGTQQTHVGYEAGMFNQEYYTTHVGFRAGKRYWNGSTGGDLTNSTEGIYIGSDSTAAGPDVNNEIVIGSQQVGHGSNTATWGDYSTLENYFQGMMYTRVMGTTATHYGQVIRNFAESLDLYKFDALGVHHQYRGTQPTGTANVSKQFVDNYTDIADNVLDEVCTKFVNSNGDVIELKKLIDASFTNVPATGHTPTDDLIEAIKQVLLRVGLASAT